MAPALRSLPTHPQQRTPTAGSCGSRRCRRARGSAPGSEVEVLRHVGVWADALCKVHQFAHALDVLLDHGVLVVLQELVLVCPVCPAPLVLPDSTRICRVGLVPLLVAQCHGDVGRPRLGVLAARGERHHLVQLPDHLVAGLVPLQLLDERRNRALDLLQRAPALEDGELRLLQVPALEGGGLLQLAPPRAHHEARKVLHKRRGRCDLLPRQQVRGRVVPVQRLRLVLESRGWVSPQRGWPDLCRVPADLPLLLRLLRVLGVVARLVGGPGTIGTRLLVRLAMSLGQGALRIEGAKVCKTAGLVKIDAADGLLLGPLPLRLTVNQFPLRRLQHGRLLCLPLLQLPLRLAQLCLALLAQLRLALPERLATRGLLCGAALGLEARCLLALGPLLREPPLLLQAPSLLGRRLLELLQLLGSCLSGLLLFFLCSRSSGCFHHSLRGCQGLFAPDDFQLVVFVIIASDLHDVTVVVVGISLLLLDSECALLLDGRQDGQLNRSFPIISAARLREPRTAGRALLRGVRLRATQLSRCGARLAGGGRGHHRFGGLWVGCSRRSSGLPRLGGRGAPPRLRAALRGGLLVPLHLGPPGLPSRLLPSWRPGRAADVGRRVRSAPDPLRPGPRAPVPEVLLFPPLALLVLRILLLALPFLFLVFARLLLPLALLHLGYGQDHKLFLVPRIDHLLARTDRFHARQGAFQLLIALGMSVDVATLDQRDRV
mmetsp:Transcript_33828/g.105527  ORF Transcript_33828/g.105527 Transcript_33828/m.105527 type:complete len:717 (-) Transcript_33828:39-2189(-)